MSLLYETKRLHEWIDNNFIMIKSSSSSSSIETLSSLKHITD